MSYLTARKRAEGLGSAKSGTEHYWNMTVSSIALTILVPLFVFTFGPALGSDYAEARAFYAQPFPSVVAALTLAVGWLHFKNGVQVAIEDYSQGMMRQALLVLTICISYAAIAAGLFALVRLAL